MNYNFTNKEERAKVAQAHTERMSSVYADKIQNTIDASLIYGPVPIKAKRKFDDKRLMNIQVFATDSVSASQMLCSDNSTTAVLNFASYKNPGGKFLNGSRAQEECLCHESYLYNVLKQFQGYYDWNQSNLNKGLYLNRGIYSPKVLFRDEFEVDVITCAAPNFGVASKYQNVSKEENREVLKSRIYFILDMATVNKVDNVVLGAFGCGVFKQDPYIVAEVFKECLNDYNCFKNIIFAIPEGHDEQNLIAFREVLCSK